MRKYIIICFILLTSCFNEEKDELLITDNLIAHRGYHNQGIPPENSLDAISLAAQVGYKYVELDISRTKYSNGGLANIFYKTPSKHF